MIKRIYIHLKDSTAVNTNKQPVFLEQGDKIEFIITNPIGEGDKLSYIGATKQTEVKGNSFTLDFDNLHDIMLMRVVFHKQGQKAELHSLKDILIHDVKVIGNTIDEKYPDIIRNLYNRIDFLEKTIISICEEIFELKKDGDM